MPVLIFILLVVLIAQVGFWDTLVAVLGAFAMLGLLGLLVTATVACAGYALLRRVRD